MEINGFEGVLRIEDFSLRKSRGRHGVCTFTAIINGGDCGKYMDKVGETIGVMINDGRRPIFWGEIVELELEQTFMRTAIDVTAIALTRRLDEEQHNRIFQNPDKTFGDVLNASRLSIKNCGLKLDGKFASEKFAPLILQYRETNFEFINRLAALRGWNVWSLDTRRDCAEVRVCGCLDDSATAIKSDEIIRLRIRRQKKIRAATLTLYRFIDIGRLIVLEGDPKKYLITDMEFYREGGADRFEYELTEYKAAEPSDISDDRRIKFRAEVKKVDEKLGQIEIAFDKNEVEDGDTNRMQIPYVGSNNRVEFVPDVGDKLEVIAGGGECLIHSALRKSPLESKILTGKDRLELTVGGSNLLIDKDGITIKGGKVKIGSKVELG